MTQQHLDEFADFYERAKDQCLRATWASLANADSPEDLVAEAFARAYVNWESVRQHPSPKAWVLRTALNLHRDEWRRARRGLQLVTADTTEHESSVIDPIILDALRSLSERQREVIVLRVLLGLSTRETAAELGVNETTVPVHLRRALGALRSHPHLQEYNDAQRSTSQSAS